MDTIHLTDDKSSVSCTASDAGITRFYVAYHEESALRAVHAPSDAKRININDLPLHAPHNNPAIAESRLLVAMAMNPDAWLPSDGYVGLFHASFNAKFAQLPNLAELPTYFASRLKPHYVICPITCADYFEQADRHHAGLGTVLGQILDATNIRRSITRPGPMTNSFVAHVSVWRRFLPDWLRMYTAASQAIAEVTWDTRECKPGVAPAYLCERFTTAWFAAQTDLQCLTLLGKNGAYYTTRPETQTSPDNQMVTVNGPK